jgi:hypothetical protein
MPIPPPLKALSLTDAFYFLTYGSPRFLLLDYGQLLSEGETFDKVMATIGHRQSLVNLLSSDSRIPDSRDEFQKDLASVCVLFPRST